MKLRPLQPKTSDYRRWITASALVPLALLLDVAANLSIYIVRSGLCDGVNLAVITRIQTLGAGALPPAIPYAFAPQANIMTFGPDLSLSSMVRSLIWVLTFIFFLKALWCRKFATASFCISVFFLTIAVSNIEKSHSCDLAYAHKNIEATFIELSGQKETFKEKPLHFVAKTAVSKSVIELTGIWGEPTCSVYIVQTVFAPNHVRELQRSPSWYKAKEILKEKGTPYEDALKTVFSSQNDNPNIYFSLKEFGFVEDQKETRLYSLLACDPTRMPAI